LRPPIKDSSPEEDEEAFSEFEYISPKELQESPKEILARISARTEVGKAAGSGSSNKEDLSLELAQTIKPLPPAASEAIKRILKSRPIERTHSDPRNNSTGNESEIPSSAPSTAKPSKTKHQTLSNMQPKTVHFQEPVPAGGSRTKATPTPHINEGNATVDNARKLASSIKEAVSATPPEKAPPTRLPKRIGALAILYILFISTAAPIYIFIREHAGEPVVGELVIKLKYSVGSGAVVCVAIWVLQGTFDVLGYKMIGLIIGTLAGAIVWGFHSERAREGPQQLRLPW
jgi:ABC-type Fe3+-siderophore transport system permease subunit